MIVCPTCRHRNPERSLACASCGGSLADFVYRACPACAALNAAENVFCHRCLTSLSESPTSSEAPLPDKALGQDESRAPEEQFPELVTPVDGGQIGDADSVTSEPGSESESDAAVPEPEAAESEPEAKAAEPEAAESEPDEGEPEPEAVESEPELKSTEDAQNVIAQDISDKAIADESQESVILPMEPGAEADQALEGRSEGETFESVEYDIVPEAPSSQESPPSTEQTTARAASEGEDTPIEMMGVWMAHESLPDESGVKEDAIEGARALPTLGSGPGGELPGEDSDASPLRDDNRSREQVEIPSADLAQDSATRAGEDQGIPVETVVSLPHRAALTVLTGPSDADRLDAELFQRIAQEPASLDAHLPGLDVAGALPSAGAAPHSRGRLGQIALRLIVLLAAIVPLITGSLTSPWVQPRDSVLAAAKTMAAIPEGAVVLISFDYGPSYAGELEPLARALVHQLASNSVQTIAISTLATGPALAERVYEAVSRQIPEYAYGQDYAILGFLPGQEAGLRLLRLSFADAFRADHLGQRISGELPILQEIASLQDFDQVIVLADDGSSVRNWVEQVGGTKGIVLHAFVSSRIEPLLQPYHQSGQLESLIGAADGAAEYELASGSPPSQLLRTDSFAILFLIFATIAIVTNVVWLSRGVRRRSSK